MLKRINKISPVKLTKKHLIIIGIIILILFIMFQIKEAFYQKGGMNDKRSRMPNDERLGLKKRSRKQLDTNNKNRKGRKIVAYVRAHGSLCGSVTVNLKGGYKRLPSDTNVIYFSNVGVNTPMVLNRFLFEQIIKPSYYKDEYLVDNNNEKSDTLVGAIKYYNTSQGGRWLKKMYEGIQKDKKIDPITKKELNVTMHDTFVEDIRHSLKSIHINPKGRAVNYQKFYSPIIIELYYSDTVKKMIYEDNKYFLSWKPFFFKYQIPEKKFGYNKEYEKYIIGKDKLELNIHELIKEIKKKLNNRNYEELTIITPVCRGIDDESISNYDDFDFDKNKTMALQFARQVSRGDIDERLVIKKKDN